MNVAKKLIFGFCILASFQNTMYAAELGGDSSDSLLRNNQDQEGIIYVWPNKQQELNIGLSEKQHEVYNHNLEIIRAANFEKSEFFKNVALEKAYQGIKMGVLHVILPPENLPAKPFFDTFKTKVANIPGAVVETILGYKWEEWQEARQEAIDYPKPGKNQKNKIEINTDQIKDDKNFVEQIYEMADRANFPKNISITFQKGITSGNPELGDPYKMEITPEDGIKYYTIIINPLYPKKLYNIAEKLATIEPGEFNHIRKFAWYKTWGTLAGALGGLLLCGGAAYARENQFSPKTFAIAGGGMVGGALFSAIAANYEKKCIEYEEECEKQERAMQIHQAKKDVKESIQCAAHVIETYQDPKSGIKVQEIEYLPSPSSQYPRKYIVPARIQIENFNKVAAGFPEKRTRNVSLPEL